MLTCNTLEDRSLVVPVPGAWLQGRYREPAAPRGLVLIGFGAEDHPQGRHANALAQDLHDGGLATLLVDLLDGEERADAPLGLDSNLLTERWITIAQWLRYSSPYAQWNVGLYASGVPAAGALMAAARQPDEVQAVVTRNGRADLAENWLPLVEAPTLLLVDSEEGELVEVNRRAVRHLDTSWRMVELADDVAPGNSPSRLGRSANRLVRLWFLRNLRAKNRPVLGKFPADWSSADGSDAGELS